MSFTFYSTGKSHCLGSTITEAACPRTFAEDGGDRCSLHPRAHPGGVWCWYSPYCRAYVEDRVGKNIVFPEQEGLGPIGGAL